LPLFDSHSTHPEFVGVDEGIAWRNAVKLDYKSEQREAPTAASSSAGNNLQSFPLSRTLGPLIGVGSSSQGALP